MHELKKQKIALIVGAAALIVIVVFAAVLGSANAKKRNNNIILPQQQETRTADPSSDPQQNFSSVTPDNVQSVLSSMSRADCYYQAFAISIETNEKSVEKQVEIWMDGERFSAVVTSEPEKKYFLGNHETVYVWYADNQTPQQVTLSEDMTMDSLLGVADYSTILKLDKQNINEASFVSLPELSGSNCIFVLINEHGMQQHYWISMETGLLCKQTTLLSDVPLYSLQQTDFEVLSPNEPSLAAYFLLPDGTNPFITE